MSESPKRSFEPGWAALCGFVSLVIHTAAVFALFPAPLQFSKYPRAAEQYLAGTLPPERILDFSPFYFHLHTLQARLIGGEVVVFLQILVSAAAAGVLFILLRRYVPLWAATLGALAFTLNRGVIVYTAVLEPEIFLVFFLVCFLYFAAGSRPRDPWLAGLFLALCLSVRPTALPVLATVPFFHKLNGRDWTRHTFKILAPSLVLMVLLAVRNGTVVGHPSPLGMNPGYVFFEGNNPLSSGKSAVYPPVVGELKEEIPEHPDNPHLTYRLVASRETGRELGPGESNEYWRAKAIDYAVDHPWHSVERMGAKLHAVAQNYRRHDLIPARRFDENLTAYHVPSFPFALLVVGAALGITISIGQWRQLLLVHASLFSSLLVMAVMYVSERQRLAALPALIVFAGLALARYPRTTGVKRVAVTAGVISATLLLLVPTYQTREDRHLWTAHAASNGARDQALQLRDAGRLSDARVAAAAGYAAAPWLRDQIRPAGIDFMPAGFAAWALAVAPALETDPSLRFDRAQLLLDAGHLEEAQGLLDELIGAGHRFDRGFVQSSEPHYYLARVELARRDREGALRHLNEALARAPGDPFVLAALAVVTGDEKYLGLIERYFGTAHAAYLTGLYAVENGLGQAELMLAAGSLVEAVELVPELRRAQIYLVAALAGSGRVERATDIYVRAMGERQDPALAEEWILPALAEQAAGAPDDPFSMFGYGLALAQYGKLDQALAVLRTAWEMDPQPEIARTITNLERLRETAK